MVTSKSYPIPDTFLGVAGASAQLSGISDAIISAASEDTSTPAGLKHVAHTIQAHTLRAALAVVALASSAGRLEAFAHAQAIDAEECERELAAARATVEEEAERDAELYRLDSEAAQRPSLATWAHDAFQGTWEGGWEYTLLVTREQAETWYRDAFTAAVHRAGGAS